MSKKSNFLFGMSSWKRFNHELWKWAIHFCSFMEYWCHDIPFKIILKSLCQSVVSIISKQTLFRIASYLQKLKALLPVHISVKGIFSHFEKCIYLIYYSVIFEFIAYSAFLNYIFLSKTKSADLCTFLLYLSTTTSKYELVS